MKVIKEVKVDYGSIDTVVISVAKSTLTRLVADIGLPDAADHAPGSIGSRIKVLSVRETSPGVLVTALSIPEKYRAVEEGSGIYAGEAPFEIYPVRRKALATGFGYFKHVTFMGQPAQHFLLHALEKVAEAFPTEFANDLSRRLSSRSH